MRSFFLLPLLVIDYNNSVIGRASERSRRPVSTFLSEMPMAHSPVLKIVVES